MTEEELKNLEVVFTSLFHEASKDSKKILSGLQQAVETSKAVNDYLDRAEKAAPGPEIKAIVSGIKETSDTLLGGLENCRVAVVDLIKLADESQEPQRDFLSLVKKLSDREPQLPSEESMKCMRQAHWTARIQRCLTQFAMASGVFSFNGLFGAYLDASRALLGEHSDLLLKASAMTGAALKGIVDIGADISTAGAYSIYKAGKNVLVASQTSNLKQFVESVEAAVGPENMLALSTAYRKLTESAEFTSTILTDGSKSIRDMTTSLRADIDRFRNAVG